MVILRCFFFRSGGPGEKFSKLSTCSTFLQRDVARRLAGRVGMVESSKTSISGVVPTDRISLG